MKVLLLITTRVSSISNSDIALEKSIGSTLAKNLSLRPAAPYAEAGSVLRASKTNSGPK